MLGDVVSSVRLRERVVSINKTPISTPQVISIILIIEPHIVLGNPKMHCQEEVEKQQGPMSGGLFGKLHQEHLALIEVIEIDLRRLLIMYRNKWTRDNEIEAGVIWCSRNDA